ncbi:MAG: PAS domain S-box protein [Planctomycetaceae bacterium]|nr:PAS domain S-box protein [Planctomycetaceae bacterium]
MNDSPQQPHDRSFQPEKRTHYWVAVAALAVGVALSAAMFFQLRLAQQQRLEQQFALEGQERCAELSRTVNSLLCKVQDLAALYECSEEVEVNEFTVFAQHLLNRDTCFRALAWTPQVDASNRSAIETRGRSLWQNLKPPYRITPMQAASAPASAPDPASLRQYPILYLLPAGAKLHPGDDLYSRPELRLAMDYADALASPVLASYDLQSESLLAVVPVYKQGNKALAASGRRENLAGFAVAQIHLPDLIQLAFATELRTGVEITLTDKMADEPPRQLGRYRPSSERPGPLSSLVHEQYFDVGGRQWRLRSVATQNYIADRPHYTPWAVLGLGLVISLSISYYLLSALGRSQEVRRLVGQQTAQLREGNLLMEAEILSRRQAEGLLYLQRNLAAALGGEQSVDGVLTVSLQAALQVDGLDSGGIYTINAARCCADLAVHRGLGEEFVQSITHIDSTHPGMSAIAGGRTVVIENIPGKIPDAVWLNEGLFSAVIVPIWHQDVVVASLNLGSHHHDTVSPQTVSAVEAIASQIGGALARARVSEALRQSEQRLRVLAENVDAIFYRLDIEGRVVYASPQVARFGYDERTVVGLDFQQFIYPGDRAMVLSRFHAILSKASPPLVEYRMIAGDGSVLWMQDSSVAACDSGGRVVAVTGILQDVTHRKESEQRLRDSERRYHSLFENSPTSLWEEDFSAVREYLDSLEASGVEDLPAYLRRNGQAVRHCASLVRIVDVNAATLSIFDAPSKEVLLGNLDKVFTDSSFTVFREEIISLIQGVHSFHTDATNRTLGGKTKEIVLHVAVVPGCEKTWQRAMIGMIDITDRKQAQKALQAARQKLMHAREAERRHIAVELHDSISQSLVALQLMLHNVANTAGQTLGPAALRDLSAAVQQCTALVREVRNLCHGLYPPTLQSLGLGSGLRELARQCTAAGMAATVIDTPQTQWLRFDPDVEIALFRAAQEAANNALRHSGATHLLFTLEHDGAGVTLSITDDGKGFDPKKVGAGLGLISLRENAEAVDGTLSIDSRLGQTRVTIAAPAKPLESSDSEL